jgi:hypothetical protein
MRSGQWGGALGIDQNHQRTSKFCSERRRYGMRPLSTSTDPMNRSLRRAGLPHRAPRRLRMRLQVEALKKRDSAPLRGLRKARRKFQSAFADGFRDETYLAWEREYKWNAHSRWQEALAPRLYSRLLKKRAYREIAKTALAIESRTNLLFSFEKMAVRDAIATDRGAQAFANGLYAFLYGKGSMEERFDAWVEVVSKLPRRKTRVLTWPVVTVFGFLAEPHTHFFFKPMVTREAARRLGVDLPYRPRPCWSIYKALLKFLTQLRADLRDMGPRDMIDLQSFLWVQGSDEYPD